ncbi:MAG TPA: EamA family transporter [Patescibacteria group bacterium]|nr:EamA family transporter [Patescibacteria group bacterium]
MEGDHGTRIGTIAAVTVSLIWGLSFVAARMVLSTLTPVLLATVRFVIASAIFTLFIVKDRMRGSELESGDLRKLAVLGVLSISVYFWLQYTGVMYAGAGVSALLVVGLIPVLTGFMSTIVLKERTGARKYLGTGMGLAGVALITVPNLLVSDVDWKFYVGVAFLLLNAACWAIYSTLSRRLMKRIGRPVLVTAYVTVFGTLALIPLSLTSNWGLLYQLNSQQWTSVLYLALVCSGLGYFLWNFALLRLEAVKAAVWLYLEPVAAFAGEALILGVMPSLTTVLGGVAILVGAILTSRSDE